MSKWLRRGLGQNSNNLTSEDRQQQQYHSHTEFPSPPRNDMPSVATAGAYHHEQSHQSSMAGYGNPSPANIAMDVDNAPPSRSKYSQFPPHQSVKQPYDPSRTSRNTDDGSRSRRSSSRDHRSRSHHYPQNSSGHHPVRQGATNGPPTAQPNGHFGPPQQTPMSYSKNPPLGNQTPPDSVQPSFPPPAVTAESPPPAEAAQRRPAYLLHRDLVIGKGSYGQVCIASRGEAEGHNAGRSGKRKKFACKCVMLRNDPKYIAKLQEEVNVLRELRGHENVIRLHDVFCVDNELFIITELGRGGDLFHLLTTHPKHGVTEAYAGKSIVRFRILVLDLFSVLSN
jgi:Protein kinase domain